MLTRTTSRTKVTFSMSRYTMVHKPFSRSKAVETPAATVAMNNDWDTLRTKQLSSWSMVINTTIPLVDRTPPQLNTPQVIHDSSDTITWEIMLTILHPLHISESVFYPQSVERQCKSRSYTSCNIGRKIRTLPELWPHHDILLDSEKEKWLEHTRVPEASGTKDLTYERKAHRRLQSW